LLPIARCALRAAGVIGHYLPVVDGRFPAAVRHALEPLLLSRDLGALVGLIELGADLGDVGGLQQPIARR
jgi:hypothetical protein